MDQMVGSLSAFSYVVGKLHEKGLYRFSNRFGAPRQYAVRNRDRIHVGPNLPEYGGWCDDKESIDSAIQKLADLADRENAREYPVNCEMCGALTYRKDRLCEDAFDKCLTIFLSKREESKSSLPRESGFIDDNGCAVYLRNLETTEYKVDVRENQQESTVTLFDEEAGDRDFTLHLNVDAALQQITGS